MTTCDRVHVSEIAGFLSLVVMAKKALLFKLRRTEMSFTVRTSSDSPVLLRLLVVMLSMSALSAPVMAATLSAGSATCVIYGGDIQGTARNVDLAEQQFRLSGYFLIVRTSGINTGGINPHSVDFVLSRDFQDGEVLNSFQAQVGDVELMTNSTWVATLGTQAFAFDTGMVTEVQVQGFNRVFRFDLNPAQSAFNGLSVHTMVGPAQGPALGGLGSIIGGGGLSGFSFGLGDLLNSSIATHEYFYPNQGVVFVGLTNNFLTAIVQAQVLGPAGSGVHRGSYDALFQGTFRGVVGCQ